jgi:hypothetical protein
MILLLSPILVFIVNCVCLHFGFILFLKKKTCAHAQAAVLHLGNIAFEPDPSVAFEDATAIGQAPFSLAALGRASALLGLDQRQLVLVLTSREQLAGGRQSAYRVK